LRHFQTTGHPPDHAFANFKEGQYLKAIYFRENVKREMPNHVSRFTFQFGPILAAC